MWGVLHGTFSVFDRLIEKKEKIFVPARWICTFFVVNILWLLFRSDTIHQWWEILSKILCMQNLNISDGLISSFSLQENIFINKVLGLKWSIENIRGFWMNIYILVAGCICLMFDNNYRTVNKKSWIMMVISAIAFIWGFICLSGESVFVYFNF